MAVVAARPNSFAVTFAERPTPPCGHPLGQRGAPAFGGDASIVLDCFV